VTMGRDIVILQRTPCGTLLIYRAIANCSRRVL